MISISELEWNEFNMEFGSGLLKRYKNRPDIIQDFIPMMVMQEVFTSTSPLDFKIPSEDHFPILKSLIDNDPYTFLTSPSNVSYLYLQVTNVVEQYNSSIDSIHLCIPRMIANIPFWFYLEYLNNRQTNTSHFEKFCTHILQSCKQKTPGYTILSYLQRFLKKSVLANKEKEIISYDFRSSLIMSHYLTVLALLYSKYYQFDNNISTYLEAVFDVIT